MNVPAKIALGILALLAIASIGGQAGRCAARSMPSAAGSATWDPFQVGEIRWTANFKELDPSLSDVQARAAQDCFVAEFTAAVPGPEALDRLGQSAGDAVIRQLAQDCLRRVTGE